MKILLVGIKQENHNSRKIEGFYDAFSKIGNVEWVNNLFQCQSDTYDLVFGEINIDEIITRMSEFQKIKINKFIFWNTLDLEKLLKLSKSNLETKFVCAFKTDVLNKEILNNYKKIYGGHYQQWYYEGIRIDDFLNYFENNYNNLKLVYLPCCLSQKDSFEEQKLFDLCYFGTVHNRPNIKYILDNLSSKYKIISNYSDNGKILSPKECYNFYKKTKATLSEQVQPVVLEYPVRLGESSSTGCRLFLLEKIPIYQKNKFIPDHNEYTNLETLIQDLEDYLDNFTVDKSKKLYDSFESTYDNAVEFLINQ